MMNLLLYFCGVRVLIPRAFFPASMLDFLSSLFEFARLTFVAIMVNKERPLTPILLRFFRTFSLFSDFNNIVPVLGIEPS